MAQLVKNLPAMQETQEMQAQSLGWEDPLEDGMVTHSSIFAWWSLTGTFPGVARSWAQLKQLSTSTSVNKDLRHLSLLHMSVLWKAT